MSEQQFYSPDFFRGQSIFAKKLYQILLESGVSVDFGELLEKNTTLHREVTHKGKNQIGVDNWKRIVESEGNKTDPFVDLLTESLYAAYLENAIQDDLSRIGETCLEIEWVPEANGIQLHYVPSIRNGKSMLSRVNRSFRFQEYLEKFKHLSTRYSPETKIFGFSWLNNLEFFTWISPFHHGYFSKDGTLIKDHPSGDFSVGQPMYPIYDPRYFHDGLAMPLNSWAIWGQFLQRGFDTNFQLIQAFVQSLSMASTIEEVIDAFPYPLRYQEETLGVWYDHLNQMNTE